MSNLKPKCMKKLMIILSVTVMCLWAPRFLPAQNGFGQKDIRTVVCITYENGTGTGQCIGCQIEDVYNTPSLIYNGGLCMIPYGVTECGYDNMLLVPWRVYRIIAYTGDPKLGWRTERTIVASMDLKNIGIRQDTEFGSPEIILRYD